MKIIFMIVSLGQFENAEQHHRRGGWLFCIFLWWCWPWCTCNLVWAWRYVYCHVLLIKFRLWWCSNSQFTYITLCKKSNHITSSCITFSLCLDIDEKLDKRDLHLVKISDDGAGEEYGIEDLPCLVYFENGVPEIFEGDIRNDNQIIKWMLDELKQVLDILWSWYNDTILWLFIFSARNKACNCTNVEQTDCKKS